MHRRGSGGSAGIEIRDDPAYAEQGIVVGLRQNDDVAVEAAAYDSTYDVFALVENREAIGVEVDDVIDVAVDVITALR